MVRVVILGDIKRGGEEFVKTDADICPEKFDEHAERFRDELFPVCLNFPVSEIHRNFGIGFVLVKRIEKFNGFQ